jgi:NAD-dependent dihydropyrimidine dehydrogenase PreA subunit
MSLPVSTMMARDNMVTTECILCGSCVDNRPKGAVAYAWQRGGR